MATNQLTLSTFERGDFDRLISWITDEELLVTIAGKEFNYPLTIDQLQEYTAKDGSLSFNIVDETSSNTIGHAEIILQKCRQGKLDKIIIGDNQLRGKGLGSSIMKILLQYSFLTLDLETIELYVYDWNKAGIRCYEKAGFTLHKKTELITRFGQTSWRAFQMTISKKEWEKLYQ